MAKEYLGGLMCPCKFAFPPSGGIFLYMVRLNNFIWCLMTFTQPDLPKLIKWDWPRNYLGCLSQHHLFL